MRKVVFPSNPEAIVFGSICHHYETSFDIGNVIDHTCKSLCLISFFLISYRKYQNGIRNWVSNAKSKMNERIQEKGLFLRREGGGEKNWRDPQKYEKLLNKGWERRDNAI